MPLTASKPEASPTAALPLATSGGVRRLDFIDALRGWAFFAVLLCHSGQLIGNPSLRRLTDQGEFGVQLFYVISAATLFLSMHSRWKRDARPLGAFFVRRFFRIAPMFWLGIVFYVWWYGMGPRVWAPNGITIKDIAVTFAFAHGWQPAQINAVVPGGWSVGVEMSFYLLMPVLFFTIRSLRRALWFFGASVIVCEAASHYCHRWLAAGWPAETMYVVNKFTYFWLPAQLPVFALGGVLYFILQRKEASGTASRPALAWVLLGLAAGLACVSSVWTYPLPKQHVAYGVVFVLLAWSLSLHPFRVLVNPFTRHMGMVSFSGYLTHFFVLDMLSPRLPGLFGKLAASGGNAELGLLVALALIVTLLLSTVTYYLVEIPGQHCGKAFISYMERRFPIRFGTALPTFQGDA